MAFYSTVRTQTCISYGICMNASSFAALTIPHTYMFGAYIFVGLTGEPAIRSIQKDCMSNNEDTCENN